MAWGWLGFFTGVVNVYILRLHINQVWYIHLEISPFDATVCGGIYLFGVLCHF